jgi:predicted phosphoadenosine phosphosulfate sulfurtransferase
MKKFLNENVYDATLKRLEYIFSKFDHIVIAFSGGKDSGVLLELVHQYYKTSNYRRKVSVYHLDYEGGYEHTIQYVKRSMGKYSEFDYYHICLPISASCGISMYQSTWLPWDPENKDIWLNTPPKDAVTLDNHQFDFFQIGMKDYLFQQKLSRWLHQRTKAHRTAVLIGIRAQESLNRYATVTRNNTTTMFGAIRYSNRIYHNIFNFYPLYDWKVDDVWIAYSKFNWDYNKLYDLYYYAGVPLREMRVANPFHSCGVHALHLYQAIEPDTWGKMVGRVNGVNFASIYGNSKAVGFRNISLPKGQSWKQYVNFLLKTLPKNTRDIYLKKFHTSKNYWLNKGGALPLEVIEDLRKKKILFLDLGKPKNNRKYKSEYRLIKFYDYPDDVSIKQFRLVPSYKRMCITILKNDTSCHYMGFSQTKDELQKKKEAISLWEKNLE